MRTQATEEKEAPHKRVGYGYQSSRASAGADASRAPQATSWGEMSLYVKNEREQALQIRARRLRAASPAPPQYFLQRRPQGQDVLRASRAEGVHDKTALRQAHSAQRHPQSRTQRLSIGKEDRGLATMRPLSRDPTPGEREQPSAAQFRSFCHPLSWCGGARGGRNPSPKSEEHLLTPNDCFIVRLGFRMRNPNNF